MELSPNTSVDTSRSLVGSSQQIYNLCCKNHHHDHVEDKETHLDEGVTISHYSYHVLIMQVTDPSQCRMLVESPPSEATAQGAADPPIYEPC